MRSIHHPWVGPAELTKDTACLPLRACDGGCTSTSTFTGTGSRRPELLRAQTHPRICSMVFNHLWLRGLEIWLTARLLRSPSFHQIVGRVHQRIQHYRHGIPMEESRTSLESQGANLSKFAKYFKEEIKDQMKGNPPNKL